MRCAARSCDGSIPTPERASTDPEKALARCGTGVLGTADRHRGGRPRLRHDVHDVPVQRRKPDYVDDRGHHRGGSSDWRWARCLCRLLCWLVAAHDTPGWVAQACLEADHAHRGHVPIDAVARYGRRDGDGRWVRRWRRTRLRILVDDLGDLWAHVHRPGSFLFRLAGLCTVADAPHPGLRHRQVPGPVHLAHSRGVHLRIVHLRRAHCCDRVVRHRNMACEEGDPR